MARSSESSVRAGRFEASWPPMEIIGATHAMVDLRNPQTQREGGPRAEEVAPESRIN